MSKTSIRISAYSILLVCLSIALYRLTSEPSIDEVLLSRKKFIAEFLEREELLIAYGNEQAFLELENLKSWPVTVDASQLFYSWTRIVEEITASSKVSPEAIFDFVKRNHYHVAPLWEGLDPHQPPTYFSVYGSGFCDDAAENFVQVAEVFGIKSRTHWLKNKNSEKVDHVVAESFIDGHWRMFDPDDSGFLRESDGGFASVSTVLELVEKKALGEEFKIFSGLREGETIDRNRRPGMLWSDPYLQLEPKSRVMFFERAYMLSTDGHYLSGLSKEEFLRRYPQNGNILKEINLKEVVGFSGDLEISSFFPLVGAFLKIPRGAPAFEETLGKALLRIEPHSRYAGYRPIDGEIIEKGQYTYIDVSYSISNFEKEPSRSIVFQKLDELLATAPEAKLLLVYMYSVPALKLSESNIAAIPRDIEIIVRGRRKS